MSAEPKNPDKIPEVCSGCPSRCRCTQAALFSGEGSVTGWRLVGLSFGFFLVPIVLALVGAGLGGPEPNGRFAGAVGGLLLGMGLCWLTAVVTRRVRSKRDSSCAVQSKEKA